MGALCDLIVLTEAWPVLDAGATEAFIEATTPGIIFLRAVPSPQSETMALILRELRRECLGLLRVAVASRAAEHTIARRLGLRRLPSVAWVGAGHVLMRIEQMHDVRNYAEATDMALSMLRLRA